MNNNPSNEAPDLDSLSLCPSCNCMTYTISGMCGKCKSSKSNEASNGILEQKIYDELSVLFAGKGLSDEQYNALMNDRKESVDLIMRLIAHHQLQLLQRVEDEVNINKLVERAIQDDPNYSEIVELTGAQGIWDIGSRVKHGVHEANKRIRESL